ncbi:MAG: hypothetical protein GF393_04420 [Armatimonadia bacterium]|nr:hypothetical protein [Armatimonadia bacterium]
MSPSILRAGTQSGWRWAKSPASAGGRCWCNSCERRVPLIAEKQSTTFVAALMIVMTVYCVGPVSAELLDHVRFSRPEAPEPSVSEANRLTFDLPRVKQAPTIDGRLDEAIWEREQAYLGHFRLGLSETPARHSRQAWAAYDSGHVYIGVRLEREPGTELRVATLEPDNSAIWEDDEVEVFVDPFSSGTSYYQMILNSEGVLYDATHHYVEVPDARAASPGATVLERVTDAEWDSDLTRAVHIDDEWWSIEMALPLASIRLDGAPAGHRFGFNITSADWDTEEYTTLSPNDNWQDPLQFGLMVLGEPTIEVTDLQLSSVGVGRNLLRLDTSHLGGPAGQYTLELTFRADGQWLNKVKQFELGPGHNARVGLPFDVTAEAGEWQADIEITDPDGAAVFATRRSGTLPGPLTVDLGSSAVLTYSAPIEVSARLGVGSLTARRLTLSARLLGADGDTLAQQPLGIVEGPEIDAVMPVEDLVPGLYVFELIAEQDGDVIARGSDLFRVARSPFEYGGAEE